MFNFIKYSKYYSFFFAIISIIFLFPQNSFALSNGILASDSVGQYDQTDFTNPVSLYTKLGANDGPNRFGFDGPRFMAFDTQYSHRLFVSDFNNNRVLVYNLDGNDELLDSVPDYVLGQPNFYSKTASNTISGLNGPQGLAFDGNQNRLFVVETTGNRVKVFDVGEIVNGEDAVSVLGQTDFTGSSPADSINGMNIPVDIVINPTNGKIFVSESGGNRVKIWNLSFSSGEDAINVLGVRGRPAGRVRGGYRPAAAGL